MSDPADTGFSTRAVHTGRGFAGTTGAVMPPVFLTSTFARGNSTKKTWLMACAG